MSIMKFVLYPMKEKKVKDNKNKKDEHAGE
jgi:hypothetical protein